MKREMIYSLEMAGGAVCGSTWTDERTAREAATEILRASHGPDVVCCESWDQTDEDDERLLFWKNDADAVNDAGSKAIAQLVRRPLEETDDDSRANGPWQRQNPRK